MKRKIIYLLASAALLAGGCTATDEYTADGTGRIRMGGQIDASIETRAATTPTPTIDQFKLTIVGDGVNSSWANIDAYTAEDPLFKAGNYTASISYGDPETEGVDKPYYTASQAVTVVARKTANATLTAKVANSQAFIRATEQFLRYFHDATFTLKTGSNNSFTFTPSATSTDVPVWVKAGTKLTVTGTAKRQGSTAQDDGATVNFIEQTLAATKAATCHIFTFNASDAGSATLTIVLDDGTTLTQDVDIELNDGAIL